MYLDSAGIKYEHKGYSCHTFFDFEIKQFLNV